MKEKETADRRNFLKTSMATCMAMGQAAGAAAALAAKNGTTPLDVPLTEIHKLLRAHAAIIPA